MSAEAHRRGGASVGALSSLDAWEATLVLSLRLWCSGEAGQSQVWTDYRRALPAADARQACRTFETLLHMVIGGALRPLVRHDVGCGCIGSDEAIFVNLVRTASDGHLNDASLIATLLVGPASAEHIALLAGEVGSDMRRINAPRARAKPDKPNVIRLH